MWGGAQWLVIFLFLMRALLGAAKATGNITFAPRPQATPAREYWNQRIIDGLLLSVLWWGGFFS